MSALAEAPLVAAFAALLATAGALLLFTPLVRHVWDFGTSRAGYVALGSAMLLGSAAAATFVVLGVSDPALFAPVVAITAGLRVASPPLLYYRIREALEVKRGWSILQWLLVMGFVVLAAVLALELFGSRPLEPVLGPAVLSEQLLMAFGASFLLIRLGLRVRPRIEGSLIPVWIAAILLGLAFVVVPAYAFPGYATIFHLSGLVGWIVAAVVAFFDR